jgi:anaerobic magnesium-protoporphyrin IX monomethyl ester cyclase
MKVLLINPSSQGVFRTLGFALPPLGLLYVAAATERAGHAVTVLDRTVDSRPVDFADFDVVGLHSDTTRFGSAMNLARQARAAGTRVVMGGPHPCYALEDVMGSGAVDFVIKGEGEESFPHLLSAMADDDGFETVPGLSFLRHGQIASGPEPRRIRDVDALPMPARHLLDLDRYRAARMAGRTVMAVHTSRGCPFGCRFCSSTNFDGPQWRARSAESVLDEVQHLHDQCGARAIAFMDDNFTLNHSRLRDIAEGILRRNLDLHWWFFSRIDGVLRHPETFDLLARAGARSIFVGVEAAAVRTLESYGKGIVPEQAVEAVRLLQEKGYEVLASYILGAAHETPADIRATVRLACRIDSDTAQFTILTPYPGTPLYDDVKDRIFDREWSHYDSIHSVFRLDHFTRRQIQIELMRAYATFYTRSRRSVYGFYRFLSVRRFGLNAIAEVVKFKL